MHIDSPRNMPNFFHTQGLAVLCLRDHDFTLTNGVVSYALDRGCPNKLFKYLHYLNIGTICVTDKLSKQEFKEIQASWSSSSPFKWTPVMLLIRINESWENVHFATRRNVIVGLPCKACVPSSTNPSIPFFTRDKGWLWVASPTSCLKSMKARFVSTLFISCLSSISMMDPIHAFPEHISITVVPMTLPEKPDALEYAARQGQVRADIIYQEPNAKCVFVLFWKDYWHQKRR
ncbi:uncharacterized protein TNCV_3485561 [Trichonephila clavipes]|nr:uncharacterized protein TNCV_3485561 [Trichonephila clavipes]